MILADAIDRAVRRELTAQAIQIESDAATAMMLQDYDKLPRLCIIERPGAAPAVASMLEDIP